MASQSEEQAPGTWPAPPPGPADGRSGPGPGDWPAPGTAAELDQLEDALVASDLAGTVIYANPAAERLLGWPRGELVGRPTDTVVPPALRQWLPWEREGALTDLRVLAGRRLRINSLTYQGAEIPTELVLSVIGPSPRPVIMAALRPRGIAHLSRWTELTAMLFDTLNHSESEASPEGKVLEVLGSVLGWDVTALWALAADGALVNTAVWVDPGNDDLTQLSQARTERFGSRINLPHYVLKTAEPLWVTDLTVDSRFADGPAARAGLRTAVVFPIHYGGATVGVVELFSTEHCNDDPELVDLIRAVSRPVGELLGALELADQQERTVRQLEKARARLEFLLQASRLVSQVSDYATTLRRLAEVAVPVLGDLCLIDLVNDDGEIERMVCHHRDPAKAALCEELERDFPPDPAGAHPSMDVVRSGHSRWSGEMTEEFLRKTTQNERHYEIVRELGFCSYMAVPLVSGDRVLGTVTLVSTTPGMGFDHEDLDWAEQLGLQVASVIERARRYHREIEVSHVLQRSLLPDRLPAVEGIDLAARYLPATRWSEVGGDWYDVIADDDHVFLVVGDVEGHDARAAAYMAQLRHSLSVLLRQERNPTQALNRLNEFALQAELERLATVLVAVVDRRRNTLTMSSAGHLAPLLRTAGGTRFLTVKPGPPVGVPTSERPEATFALEPGELVLFTDGLVEKATIGMDVRLDELLASVARAPTNDPDALCDDLLGVMLPGHDRDDDVALLVASVHPL